MYFCDITKRDAKEIVPGIRIRTFWQEQMLVSVVDLDPDVVLPSHHHPEEQAGTVIHGLLTLTINGETRALTSGGTYLIPGGIPHSAVAGPEGAHVLDVFSPVRQDYKY